MRRQLELLTVFALFCLVFFLGGCDESPVDDLTGPMTEVNFDCVLVGPSLLECVAHRFAGTPPFVYEWEATFQNAQSAAGRSSVTWDYQRVCDTQDEEIGISVSLSIVEDDGRGNIHGPVTKGYPMCTPESEAASVAYPIELEPTGSTMHFHSIPRYHNQL